MTPLMSSAKYASAPKQIPVSGASFPKSKRDPFWDILFTHRAELSKGVLQLSDEPGFGFGIDWKVVEKYRI